MLNKIWTGSKYKEKKQENLIGLENNTRKRLIVN